MNVMMVHSFHHPRGGDGTYTRTLSQLLDGAGHTVVPLSMRHPDNTPSVWEHRFADWVDPRGAKGLRGAIRLARSAIWSPNARHTCAELIRDARPDVAHLQHVHRHLTPSVLDALNEASVPVVWTVHDYELVCPSGHLFTQGQPCERCRGHRYHQVVQHRCKGDGYLPNVAVAVEKAMHQFKNVWNRVDRFLCPSRFMANTLVRFGIDASRVEHQPNFIDMSHHPLATGTGHGWMVAGRLTLEKGVDIAIEAARQLPDLPLWICGRGPEEEALRRQAEGLEHVHFVGHLSPSDLMKLLRRARVVAVPSRWYENFPYAVLEAQAVGRPVIASNMGGIPEQIASGEDGVLIGPNDAALLARTVRALHDDPERCRIMGRSGRKRVRANLSPDDHLESIVQHYRSVIG